MGVVVFRSGQKGIFYYVSACLCVCLLFVWKHILKTDGRLYHFLCTVCCLWWQCNTLCISIVVDDVMFSYSMPSGDMMLPRQPRCSVLSRLTPLLHGIGCAVLDDGRCQDKVRPGMAGAEHAMCRFLMLCF